MLGHPIHNPAGSSSMSGAALKLPENKSYNLTFSLLSVSHCIGCPKKSSKVVCLVALYPNIRLFFYMWNILMGGWKVSFWDTR